MEEPTSIVIIGAGIAGTRAAVTLRTEGFAGTVTLVNGEHQPPYDHVPLSKNHLLDEPGHHELYLHDDGWYADHGIELRSATVVTGIDTDTRRVTTTEGDTIGWDRLLLATGAEPRRLDVPGAELGGVRYLRTFDDAEGLKADLDNPHRVVVVGDGFIGCEVAAAARTRGLEVTLIGRGPLPMHRALGEATARWFRDAHAAHGVSLRAGVNVTALAGDAHVEAVHLDDGTEVPADLVVVGIGALPRTGLAESAGITVDGGVLCDEHLRTDTPGVYAAGDVAAVRRPGRSRPVQAGHWANALHQGPTAARNMLGGRVRFDHTPFFFTDQYTVWMESTGSAADGDQTVLRGDPSTGERAQFIEFRVQDDRVVAGTNINIRDARDTIRTLIRSGRRIDRRRLADPDVPLGDV